jgi:hypothetical protein
MVSWFGFCINIYISIYLSLFQNLMIRFAPIMHLINSLFYSGFQQVVRSVFFPSTGWLGPFFGRCLLLCFSAKHDQMFCQNFTSKWKPYIYWSRFCNVGKPSTHTPCICTTHINDFRFINSWLRSWFTTFSTQMPHAFVIQVDGPLALFVFQESPWKL